jgi:hypothetical protein
VEAYILKKKCAEYIFEPLLLPERIPSTTYRICLNNNFIFVVYVIDGNIYAVSTYRSKKYSLKTDNGTQVGGASYVLRDSCYLFTL